MIAPRPSVCSCGFLQGPPPTPRPLTCVPQADAERSAGRLGGGQPRHSILGLDMEGVVGVGFKAINVHHKHEEPAGARGEAHILPTGLAEAFAWHRSLTLRTPHTVSHILASPHIGRGCPAEGELSPQSREAQVSRG